MRTFALLAFAAAASHVLALGIRAPDQDARATARGEAFAATADNASAIYYNPAGISYLQGANARAGIYAISLNSDFEPRRSGRGIDTRDELQVVPQFFYSYSPDDRPLSFGMGVYMPYGLALEWPDSAPFRTVAREGEITYVSLNPVVSWKVHETFAVAAGPTINYSKAYLGQGILVPGDLFRFKGDGWAYGFNAGLMWRPHERHSFGVNYRSETKVDYEGDSRFRAPFPPPFPPNQSASASFTFPQNVVFGYSFRPTPKWNLEVNVDWTDWNSLNTVTLKQVPVTPLRFHWESSFFYEFGVTRELNNGFSVSAGYIYSENSVPERTFNPVVPDSDRHIFSLGVGRDAGRLSWDVAYQLAWGPERSINNPAGAPNAAANGHYEFISHALLLSIGYRF